MHIITYKWLNISVFCICLCQQLIIPESFQIKHLMKWENGFKVCAITNTNLSHTVVKLYMDKADKKNKKVWKVLRMSELKKKNRKKDLWISFGPTAFRKWADDLPRLRLKYFSHGNKILEEAQIIDSSSYLFLPETIKPVLNRPWMPPTQLTRVHLLRSLWEN